MAGHANPPAVARSLQLSLRQSRLTPMPIFSDPRLDPVDINSSSEYFPKVTTPEVMALHMTRQWKAVHPTAETKALDAIYSMWLEAYRQVWAWHDARPSATSDEARVSSEAIFVRVCTTYGIPRRKRAAGSTTAAGES